MIKYFLIGIGCIVIVCLVWLGAATKKETVAGTDSVRTETSSGSGASLLSLVNMATLSTTQKQVFALIKQEYAKNPTGYDDTVLVYTEGFEESWCADFISWIFNKAGSPFVHPDTSYWRIPGVQTLRAYYEQYDAYHEVGSYTPLFGDVAFYFGETPDGGSAEHVALVLAVDGDRVITIGGNEGDNSMLQIRSDALKLDEKGLTAFGASGI